MNTIERLEKWKYGHKCRTVLIEIGDGYGATCWSVELKHENGKTIAEESSFWSLPEEEGGEKAYREAAKQQGVVFAVADDEDDWAGLERTINAAIDAFEMGIWEKRQPPSTEDSQVRNISTSA